MPKAKAQSVTESRPPAPSTMAAAAPRLAPEETPVRSGEARGLENTV